MSGICPSPLGHISGPFSWAFETQVTPAPPTSSLCLASMAVAIRNCGVIDWDLGLGLGGRPKQGDFGFDPCRTIPGECCLVPMWTSVDPSKPPTPVSPASLHECSCPASPPCVHPAPPPDPCPSARRSGRPRYAPAARGFRDVLGSFPPPASPQQRTLGSLGFQEHRLPL